MTQLRSALVALLACAVATLNSCSGDPPTGGGDSPPLVLRPAAAALCTGAGDREPDAGPAGSGGSSNPGAGGHNPATGGAAGSGAGGQHAGGSGGGSSTGGAGGSYGGGLGGGPVADASATVDAAPEASTDPLDAGACAADADAADGCPETDGSGSLPDVLPPPPPMKTASLPACDGVDLTRPATYYLSADDSNSMASPVIVRSLVRAGAATVNPRIVRTYEFLNYYRFAFERAPAGQLAIRSQLGSCDLTGDLALQIAIQSEPAPQSRPPMHFVLVLDTSGSMEGTPLALERAAVEALAASMQQGDLVSAVTWNVDQIPVLEAHEVTGPNDPALIEVAQSLTANGGTDLHSGLMLGYQLANSHRKAGRLRRVILISDGRANVGITDENLIGAEAEDADGEGTYLVGVGVGDGVNDTLMDKVTDAGRGAYIFLDSPEEARRIFVDRFAESVLVAARDVKIELTIPPYFGIARFYGEQYSPDPAKVRPQHMAPDDSMVLYQVLRPCHSSLPKPSDPYRVRVTWKDPQTGLPRETSQETVLGALDTDDGNLSKAAAIVAYAEALKHLRDQAFADRVASLQQVLATVRNANPGGDADLQEIESLIQKLVDNQPTSTSGW